MIAGPSEAHEESCPRCSQWEPVEMYSVHSVPPGSKNLDPWIFCRCANAKSKWPCVWSGTETIPKSKPIGNLYSASLYLYRAQHAWKVPSSEISRDLPETCWTSLLVLFYRKQQGWHGQGNIWGPSGVVWTMLWERISVSHEHLLSCCASWSIRYVPPYVGTLWDRPSVLFIEAWSCSTWQSRETPHLRGDCEATPHI